MFGGDTVTDIVASVVKTEPDWSALPQLSSVVRSLLRHCLEKDPGRRLRDIGDARIELSDALEIGKSTVVEAPAETGVVSNRKGHLIWILATGMLAVVSAVLGLILLRPASEPGTYRYTLPNLENETAILQIQISPDGRHLARVTEEGLWVRQLDQTEGRLLAGTVGASYPFWSNDNRWLGFFANGSLRKVEIGGGPAQTLCDVGNAGGGTWNADGTILFAELAKDRAIFRVSSAGGQPSQVIGPESETAALFYPQFLPDGRHFIFSSLEQQLSVGQVSVGSLDSPEVISLVGSDYKAMYAESGYILFERESTLMAQGFDASTLSLDGEAFPVAENLVWNIINRLAGFSVARNGQLAYRSGRPATFQLTWFDRSGQREVLAPTGDFDNTPRPALAPGNIRIAYERNEPKDIWIFDTERGTNTRFTFDDGGDTYAVVSPDGSRIAFASTRGGNDDLYVKSTSGVGEPELLLDLEDRVVPTDWSQDGLYVLYTRIGADGRSLWALPMEDEGEPILIADVPFDMRHGKISPDGNWVAYVSGESQPNQIYIEPFPGTGRQGKWQISATGGQQPVWSVDGRTLYFLSQRNLMAVSVTLGTSVEAAIPEAMFEVTGLLSDLDRYAVTRDGQRFLFATTAEDTSSSLFVDTNWLAGRQN